jgi:hypothetical protein
MSLGAVVGPPAVSFAAAMVSSPFTACP